MYIRKIDSLGRLPIPEGILQKLGLEKEAPLSMQVLGESLLVEKYTPACMLCGSTEQVLYFNQKLICKNCITEILNQSCYQPEFQAQELTD